MIEPTRFSRAEMKQRHEEVERQTDEAQRRADRALTAETERIVARLVRKDPVRSREDCRREAQTIATARPRVATLDARAKMLQEWSRASRNRLSEVHDAMIAAPTESFPDVIEKLLLLLGAYGAGKERTIVRAAIEDLRRLRLRYEFPHLAVESNARR